MKRTVLSVRIHYIFIYIAVSYKIENKLTYLRRANPPAMYTHTPHFSMAFSHDNGGNTPLFLPLKLTCMEGKLYISQAGVPVGHTASV